MFTQDAPEFVKREPVDRAGGGGTRRWPVAAGAGLAATVQDPDVAVRELAQGGVVADLPRVGRDLTVRVPDTGGESSPRWGAALNEALAEIGQTISAAGWALWL
jgi:hypothetical protein